MQIAIPEPVPLLPIETVHTGFAQGLAIAFGSVWTASGDDTFITRIDPVTRRLTVIDGLDGAYQVVPTDDAMWVGSSQGVVRVDPARNAVVSKIGSSLVNALVFSFGSLWAAGGGRVVRLDPRTEATIVEINAFESSASCALSAVAESIWLGCGQTLDRIDPATNKIVATIPRVGSNPAVVSAGGATWIWTGKDRFNTSSPTAVLARLDPAAAGLAPGPSLLLVSGASVPGALPDGDVVWFPTSAGTGPGAGMLYEFDPRSGVVVKAYDLSEGKGYGDNAIALGYGFMWAASGNGEAVRQFPIPPK